MRALLVVNPMATTTTERGRDVLVRALRSAVGVEVAYTRRRGHAASLARQAADSGLDVVVTLGGDGTVNEAVNGIMTAGGGSATDRRPALAVVPGGSTNVFARALGLPKDWAEATGVILEALRDGRARQIGLGLADDRYFTFCAGMGLDAAVIGRVERARLRGRVSTPALYLRSTARQYLRDWVSGWVPANQPAITLERPAEPPEEKLTAVVVQNTSPWTYLGSRAISPNPDASFDLALDLMALRGLNVPNTTRTVTQLLANRDAHGKQVLRLHDVAEFTLRAGRAQPFQLDGDYLGERDKVRFTAVPEALRVIC